MIYQDKYSGSSLQAFAEKLVGEHYTTLTNLCMQARAQAEKVTRLENGENTSPYTMLCGNIIGETEKYIGLRNEKYVPYILTLSSKADANHDCSTCSGGCKLTHDVYLPELKVSNDMMQHMLNKLQIASLPLYSDTLYPDEYRLLRNHMALIENSLTEIFFLENNYLIPKVMDAQKSINASH